MDTSPLVTLLVRGDAATAIAGMLATKAHYLDALDLLKRRFGDKKRLEHSTDDNAREATELDRLLKILCIELGSLQGLWSP
ncbi:hypothetical protein HPB50_021764 [Hyalomma asiaticum]|uniref:Uncharacterized protein n=1 Tax=Hyalomma asiaticum TaxID=266040 RepID=A0ACB7S4W2_HYAAI|nr:hypothetical protein HPB50_021764 [Hyalomma asiaticum]